MRATWPSTIGRRAVFSAWRIVSGSMSLAQEMSLSFTLVGMVTPSLLFVGWFRRIGIFGDRAMGCQGGARTPAFRVTAGRLSARLPGMGTASPARFERATFAFGTRRSSPLSYGELDGVDGRSRTCNLRFRRPAPFPFGHVDVSAVDGIRTRILRRDGPVLEPLSYDSNVRALGLEPSLVPVKSRVPYPSGVTRVSSRSRVAAAPMTMSVQLSRCWCPGLACPARMSRLGRCRTPAVGVGDRAPPRREPIDRVAHDVVRAGRRVCKRRRARTRRPTSASIASRTRVCDRGTRVRADAGGWSPHRFFGGEFACHRTTMMRERASRVKRFSGVNRGAMRFLIGGVERKLP